MYKYIYKIAKIYLYKLYVHKYILTKEIRTSPKRLTSFIAQRSLNSAKVQECKTSPNTRIQYIQNDPYIKKVYKCIYTKNS